MVVAYEKATKAAPAMRNDRGARCGRGTCCGKSAAGAGVER
jgi:hypothetical protein